MTNVQKMSDVEKNVKQKMQMLKKKCVEKISVVEKKISVDEKKNFSCRTMWFITQMSKNRRQITPNNIRCWMKRVGDNDQTKGN